MVTNFNLGESDQTLKQQIIQTVEQTLIPLKQKLTERHIKLNPLIQFNELTPTKEQIKHSEYCEGNCFFVTNGSEPKSKIGQFGEWHIFRKNVGFVVSDLENLTSHEFWGHLSNLVYEHILFNPKEIDSKTDLLDETKYALSFTLLNSQPKDKVYLWDYEDLFHKYLKTFLEKLSFISFSVDGQVLSYGNMVRKKILYDQSNGYYFIRAKSLESFMSETHWNFDTPLTDRERLNFLVFVPPHDKQPLYIKNANERVNSFIIPKWGGVYIWNPPKSSRIDCQLQKSVCHVDSVEFKAAAETIVYQIRQILGLENRKAHNEGFKVESHSSSGINERELNAVFYSRIKENVENYAKKLFSLYSQFDTVKELPITKEVSDLVQHSLALFEKSRRNCLEENIRDCLENSKKALELITAAYFDSSIVSRLYFSLEYTLTVFAPFIVIAFLPVLKNVVAEIKQWLSK